MRAMVNVPGRNFIEQHNYMYQTIVCFAHPSRSTTLRNNVQ